MLMRPFGGINSTPRDMARFVRLFLNDGYADDRRLVHPQSISRMEVPLTSLAARNGLLYGYGLGNNQKFRKGVLFNGHGGDADGYLSQVGYNRDTGMGYFVVINAFRHRALSEMRREIETWIIRDLEVPRPLPPAKLSDWRPAALCRRLRPGGLALCLDHARGSGRTSPAGHAGERRPLFADRHA